jgi:hypothetical protein
MTEDLYEAKNLNAVVDTLLALKRLNSKACFIPSIPCSFDDPILELQFPSPSPVPSLVSKIRHP